MKKAIQNLIIAAFIFLPVLMNAQSPIDKLFEEYTGQEGFTTVNISKEMFQMIQQLNAGSDTSALEMKKMMEQLNGLKVLTFNADSAKRAKVLSYYKEFSALFPPSVYKELMTVNDEGQNIRFMTRQESNGRISEMVMLMKGDKEMVVLSLTGNIDLATISKLSKGMNIHGMENLEKIKESPKKDH